MIAIYSTLLVTALSAQTACHEISVGGMWGQMLDIYPNFPIRGWHTAGELRVARQRKTMSSDAFGHPTSGVVLSIHNLGNNAVLGWGAGLQYEMKFGADLHQRLRWTASFRPGIIYNNRYFDIIENPENIVTGSRFSALMTVTTGLQFQLDHRWNMEFGASIWHSSNGHTALPNVGMNSTLAYVRIGHRFRFRATMDTARIDLMQPLNNMRHVAWQVHFGYGLNEAGSTVRPVGGPLLQKYLLSTGIMLRLNRAQRLSLSIDAYHDETYALWNASQQWNESWWSNKAVMILAGHEFMYQRWSLLLAAGVNLYNPTLDRIVFDTERPTIANTIKRYVPGRFAIRYHFLNPWLHRSNAYLQAGIKSNFGQADFLEFGLGFMFAKQRG